MTNNRQAGKIKWRLQLGWFTGLQSGEAVSRSRKLKGRTKKCKKKKNLEYNYSQVLLSNKLISSFSMLTFSWRQGHEALRETIPAATVAPRSVGGATTWDKQPFALSNAPADSLKPQVHLTCTVLLWLEGKEPKENPRRRTENMQLHTLEPKAGNQTYDLLVASFSEGGPIWAGWLWMPRMANWLSC